MSKIDNLASPSLQLPEFTGLQQDFLLDKDVTFEEVLEMKRALEEEDGFVDKEFLLVLFCLLCRVSSLNKIMEKEKKKKEYTFSLLKRRPMYFRVEIATVIAISAALFY